MVTPHQQVPEGNSQNSQTEDDQESSEFYLAALKSELQELRLALEFKGACPKIERSIPHFLETMYRSTSAYRKLVDRIHALRDDFPIEKLGPTRATKQRDRSLVSIRIYAEHLLKNSEKLGIEHQSAAEKARERYIYELKQLTLDLSYVDGNPGIFARNLSQIRPVLEKKIARVKAKLSKFKGAIVQ